MKRQKTDWSRVPWTPFQPAELLPEDRVGLPPGFDDDQIFMNSRYQVNVKFLHTDNGLWTHLSIKTRDKQAYHDWRDFQRIKNELVGPEFEAVEIYPAEDRLVDSSNQYHLWVLPQGQRVPAGFTGRFVMEEQWGKARQRPFDPDVRPADCLTRQQYEDMLADVRAKGEAT